jgi:SpoIID/LytB domain protein
MRLIRPFILFGAIMGAFATGAQIQSQRADAQFTAVSKASPEDPIDRLPAPPSSKTPSKAVTKESIKDLLSKRTPAPAPTPVLLTRPTPVPTLKPRFTGQRVIRVGLSTAGGAIAVYVPGGATLFDLDQPGLTMPVPVGERFQFSTGPERAVKRGSKVFHGPLSISMKGKSFDGWQHVYIAVGGDNPRVTTNGKSPLYGRPYRGDLEVFPQQLGEPVKRKGPLALVNVVPLEAYLKGVVPWEMDPTAPLEALKAQAICARTKTLQFADSKKFAPGNFDICDYDACQGYPGTENEKPSTSAAVEGTSGLALYQNGKPIDAVYSTNSGGITAAARDVWKATTPITYLQCVPDFAADSPIAKLWQGGMTEEEWGQFCAQDWPSYARPDGLASNRYEARKYRWSEFISVEDAKKVFANRGFDTITGFEVVQRTESGRIRQLRVVGTSKGSPVLVPNPNPGEEILATKFVTIEGDGKIRAMFSGRLGSTTALPSSLFVVTPKTDASGVLTGWNLLGAGWGHGVGMCQRGAQNHAREGWDARRILSWYYRDVQVRKIS